MKVKFLAIVGAMAAAGLFSTAALADCDYPKAPSAAPNGNTATRDEMVAGKQAIDQYQKDINKYLQCLDDEANAQITEAGDNKDMVKQIKEMTAKRHNAAIDELQSHADEFNTQLHAFLQKQKS